MKKKRKKLNSLILILLVVILAVILLLLMIESGLIKPVDKKMARAQKNFTIQDICSLMVGKIVHPIDSEEDCQTKCIAECEVNAFNYDSIEFQKKENDCNRCICNCK